MGEIERGLDDLTTHCGHTLTNLKLTVRDMIPDDEEENNGDHGKDADDDREDVLCRLNSKLVECTKLRHVRLLIGEMLNHSVNGVSSQKKESGLNQGRGSMVSTKGDLNGVRG